MPLPTLIMPVSVLAKRTTLGILVYRHAAFFLRYHLNGDFNAPRICTAFRNVVGWRTVFVRALCSCWETFAESRYRKHTVSLRRKYTFKKGITAMKCWTHKTLNALDYARRLKTMKTVEALFIARLMIYWKQGILALYYRWNKLVIATNR